MSENSQKEKFLHMFVKEGKSVPIIAEKLGMDVDNAYSLKEELELDILDLKAKEYDKIVQKYGLSHIDQFKYKAELYKRLKAELDKRDFSGLPTDKLYYILDHVSNNINGKIKHVIDHDSDDLDYLDDYFDDDLEF